MLPAVFVRLFLPACLQSHDDDGDDADAMTMPQLQKKAAAAGSEEGAAAAAKQPQVCCRPFSCACFCLLACFVSNFFLFDFQL